MKPIDYRELGLQTYGNKCEICGHSAVEVHHISYQEHNEIENQLRFAVKNKADSDYIEKLKIQANGQGYLNWDSKTKQLSKDDRSFNLSVLCGNCHTTMHKLDVGMKILNILPERK